MCIFVKKIRAPLPLVGVWEIGAQCPQEGSMKEGMGDKRQAQNV